MFIKTTHDKTLPPQTHCFNLVKILSKKHNQLLKAKYLLPILGLQIGMRIEKAIRCQTKTTKEEQTYSKGQSVKNLLLGQT